MRIFVLDIIVIELFSTGGFSLEEASEYCSQ
jgi:predicted HTH domain antitoxin